MITQTLRMEEKGLTDEIEGLEHRNIMGIGFKEIKQKETVKGIWIRESGHVGKGNRLKKEERNEEKRNTCMEFEVHLLSC